MMHDEAEASDEELMAGTGAGDDRAFAMLVRRHQNLVYGTVAKMLGPDGRDGAEDVAQQIFVRVYRAAPRWKPQAKFTTWLLTVVRNCVFTEQKKLSRRMSRMVHEPAPSEEGGETSFDRHADQEMLSSDQQVMQREMEEAVNAAVAGLPEAQRMALVLRQYEQLDYEEIAAVLKTTVPAVKSLLFRARETLRASLQRHLDAT
jgi:RNA polymerase sigma-70 factor (ECF subfamily)